MTTLRFVGDVPLWVGLLAALVVCVLSWRYYSRESFGLPRRLRWLLPLLRSAAFLLGILVLTGPVLHHRTILGELGRVKIYVDDSRSMTMQDRHMSTGRKLLVAEQLGWISAGRIDSKLLKLADQLSEARQGFVDAIAPKSSAPAGDPGAVSSDAAPPAAADPKTADAATANPTVVNAAPAVTASTVRTAVDAFRSRLLELKASLPSELSERYQNELLQPLDVTASTIDADAAAAANALVALAKVCETLERSVRSSCEAEVSRIVESGEVTPDAAAADPDATLTVTPGLLLRMATRDETAWREIGIDGDTALAGAVHHLWRHLRWDAEEDLSRVFGDVAAHRIAGTAHTFGQWARMSGENLVRSLSEYWTEERPAVAASNDLSRFAADVDLLRDDLARLEKRVARLIPR